nr:immunoglobulin heavy chain junction region [Macaca mulatta]
CARDADDDYGYYYRYFEFW